MSDERSLETFGVSNISRELIWALTFRDCCLETSFSLLLAEESYENSTTGFVFSFVLCARFVAETTMPIASVSVGLSNMSSVFALSSSVFFISILKNRLTGEEGDKIS